MSKIQQQVIFHIKKNSYNFSIDFGLNRLGFFKFRRYNLRDNFLRICSNNRKRVRAQLAIVLQRKYRYAHMLSLSLKSYSAFFLTFIPKYFKNKIRNLYDVNVFSYIYFLNRLFFHLNSFLLNFSFYNVAGFINLNFFYNLLHLLYPGVVYKNLIYKLWFQTIYTNLGWLINDIKARTSSYIIYSLKASLVFSKHLVKAFKSQKIFIQKFLKHFLVTKFISLNKSSFSFSNKTVFSFKKISLAKLNLTKLL